jgi:hypothetical protein
MNPKTKSFLYFTCLVLAVVTYYYTFSIDTVQNTELAENMIAYAATQEAFN